MDNTGFTIPANIYNFLKFVALVVLPAAAALVITLGSVLNWSGATVTAGVITAVDTFMGLVLGKSSSNFQQQSESIGEVVIGMNEEGKPELSRVSVDKKDPVFKDGAKVFLTVRKE